MESLFEIFKTKETKSPLMRGVKTSLILEFVNGLLLEIFGENILDKVRALYLKNKLLTIASLSSVFAQEIKLNEKRIIREVNKKFGEGTVEKMGYLG